MNNYSIESLSVEIMQSVLSENMAKIKQAFYDPASTPEDYKIEEQVFLDVAGRSGLLTDLETVADEITEALPDMKLPTIMKIVASWMFMAGWHARGRIADSM